MPVRRHAVVLLAGLLLAPLAPIRAGHWIVPAWPEGKEPAFPPEHLFWFVVNDCPLIYRAEIDVPDSLVVRHSEGARSVAPLASGLVVRHYEEGWTVSKFPPTTILEDQPVMKLGYKGPAAPVRKLIEERKEDLEDFKDL